MNDKLIVLYEEDKNNPKNTWSGTSYQLREALKNYFDVIFVDSNDPKLLKVLKLITKRIEKKTKSIILKPLYEKLHKDYIKGKLTNYPNVPVLEIGENVIVDNPFYLYRDMAYACYPYVLDKFKDDNNDYGHGMLSHVSAKALSQRIENEKELSLKANKSFFMGNWVANKMKDIYPEMKDKFVAVGGGLNKEFTDSDDEKDNSKKILFVGIDFNRKGGDLLIDAFKVLKEKYDNDAELIIAGCDINDNYDGIRCVGRKTREELSKLFNEANVFCMPSRFEAYGLVFIEALSYGLPIVTIDDYEMHYFINDKNGYLIKNYNVEELALALYDAINDKEMKEYVKMNKDKVRKQYSWENVAKKIYEEINE